MNIQPNRILARIIEEVERSDWPPLDSRTISSSNRGEWFRYFTAPTQRRYSTPFHFWVHALRDDLHACARGEDLMGMAGYALCQNQSLEDWRSDIGENLPIDPGFESEARIYRMQASECRRSSVASNRDRLFAHFWGHGAGESWRREG